MRSALNICTCNTDPYNSGGEHFFTYFQFGLLCDMQRLLQNLHHTCWLVHIRKTEARLIAHASFVSIQSANHDGSSSSKGRVSGSLACTLSVYPQRPAVYPHNAQTTRKSGWPRCFSSFSHC